MTNFADLALAIAKGGDPQGGLDTAVDMIQRSSRGVVPDTPEFRAALEIWDVKILGAGHPISKLIGSDPTIDLDLPEKWEVRHIDGGHNGLYDDQGNQRLWWHIHGWDPLATRIEHRFEVIVVDTGPSTGTIQVMDGDVSIHAYPFEYPHHRGEIQRYGNRVNYELDWDSIPKDQRRDMAQANSDIKWAKQAEARKWLDKNRPNWGDNAQSWMIKEDEK